ncbi:MAG: 2-oxoacid:acceptor oxidoreductase subunit alpha [Myxococcales bacterium]|nr:2-oxoacid:acceptor oxidoreductase subunit alpha [Myxococcales bacterium]
MSEQLHTSAPAPHGAPIAFRSTKPSETLTDVVIRFAGDSGDGIQLTGTQFTQASALAGNDTATFPDFPAEIRAPAGTLAGVSGFQLHFASSDIFTPGDLCDVLVVMNPAALASNQKWLKEHGMLIANADAFTAKNLKMAGYERNPLDDGSLADWQVFRVDLARLTNDALIGMGLSAKEVERCKNYFALGLVFWLYERQPQLVEDDIEKKFASKPLLKDANIKVFRAGWDYGENTDQFRVRYHVPAAKIAPGKYRSLTGNEGVALGFVAAAQKAGLGLYYSGYPITPASDVLHQLSLYKEFGVRTMQAEDEIAAVCSAIGASFGNWLAITGTSGPGVCLKAEAIGLAVMTELPLVILDVQRGGPSTGLPTKTEQADLLQAIYGRNGECPLPVIAARSPADSFECAFEACRVALKYMVPVILLTDGSIANGAEPWRIPNVDDLPPIPVRLVKDRAHFGDGPVLPYQREAVTLARPWLYLGTPGLEHRLGGIEKWDSTGHISYDAANHHHMVKTRQAKVDAVTQEMPPTEVIGDRTGDVLVLSWGSPWGACVTAVQTLRAQGRAVSHAHVRWLNPLPPDLGAVLAGFRRVLVPEINNGQLIKLVRATYLVDAQGFNRINGQPISVAELTDAILDQLPH